MSGMHLKGMACSLTPPKPCSDPQHLRVMTGFPAGSPEKTQAAELNCTTYLTVLLVMRSIDLFLVEVESHSVALKLTTQLRFVLSLNNPLTLVSQKLGTSCVPTAGCFSNDRILVVRE